MVKRYTCVVETGYFEKRDDLGNVDYQVKEVTEVEIDSIADILKEAAKFIQKYPEADFNPYIGGHEIYLDDQTSDLNKEVHSFYVDFAEDV